jgi:hypothetical protein
MDGGRRASDGTVNGRALVDNDGTGAGHGAGIVAWTTHERPITAPVLIA